jgi:hypothetical protein
MFTFELPVQVPEFKLPVQESRDTIAGTYIRNLMKRALFLSGWSGEQNLMSKEELSLAAIVHLKISQAQRWTDG